MWRLQTLERLVPRVSFRNAKRMRLVPLQVWEFETHLYWNLLWRLTALLGWTEHDAFHLQRFSLRLFCNVMDRLQSQFSQGHPVDVWTALNEDVVEIESIMDHPHDLKCKIVVVGDTQCGKTSLLSVFAKDSFPEVGLKSSLAFALYFSRLYGSYSEFILRHFMNAKHKPKWIFLYNARVICLCRTTFPQCLKTTRQVLRSTR